MLQKYNFYKVLEIFLENPTKGFGWKDLSKKSGLGPPSTKRYLDDMIKTGLVVTRSAAIGLEDLYRRSEFGQNNPKQEKGCFSS